MKYEKLDQQIFKTNRKNLDIVAEGKLLPTVTEFIAVATTFGLTVFAWIFFRSESVHQAFSFIYDMVTGFANKASFQQTYFILYKAGYSLLLLIFLFFAIEWLGREQQYAIARLGLKWKKPVRYVFYYLLIISLFWYGGKEQQFIYFQF